MTIRRALPLLLLLLAATAGAQTAVSVRYRSAETVYLDAGSAAGLAVGDRLEVLRGNAVAGVVEVIYTAERSASCRVISETTPIATGDRVRKVGSAAPLPRNDPPPARAATAFAPAPRTMSLSGTATVDVEASNGQGDDAIETTRAVGRLNFRLRDIAGLPLHFRMRLRAAEENRDGALPSFLPANESRNRFYQLELQWEPPSGRYAVHAGRLGANPFLGTGYLDGVMARVRVLRGIDVGGFAGLRPDLEELTFSGDRTKAGLFTRFGPGDSPQRDWDVTLVAGSEALDGGETRTFVSADARYDAGGVAAFFGHMELGSNEESAAADDYAYLSPKSSIALTALARVTSDGRLVASYERLESRDTGEVKSFEQRLAEFTRQGARVSYEHGSAARFHAAIGGGVRTGENFVTAGGLPADAGETFSAHASVGHGNLFGIGLALQASAFRSDQIDGGFASLRGWKQFAGGHLVELSAGAFVTDQPSFGRQETTLWTRAALWLELPLAFFARGEIEVSDGQRLSAGFGRRF